MCVIFMTIVERSIPPFHDILMNWQIGIRTHLEQKARTSRTVMQKNLE